MLTFIIIKYIYKNPLWIRIELQPIKWINNKIMYLFTIVKTLFLHIQTNERDSDAECSSVLA